VVAALGQSAGKSVNDAGSFGEPMSWTRERTHWGLLRRLSMAMRWMHYSEMEDEMHSLCLLFTGNDRVNERPFC